MFGLATCVTTMTMEVRLKVVLVARGMVTVTTFPSEILRTSRQCLRAEPTAGASTSGLSQAAGHTADVAALRMLRQRAKCRCKTGICADTFQGVTSRWFGRWTPVWGRLNWIYSFLVKFPVISLDGVWWGLHCPKAVGLIASSHLCYLFIYILLYLSFITGWRPLYIYLSSRLLVATFQHRG